MPALGHRANSKDDLSVYAQCLQGLMKYRRGQYNNQIMNKIDEITAIGSKSRSDARWTGIKPAAQPSSWSVMNPSESANCVGGDGLRTDETQLSRCLYVYKSNLAARLNFRASLAA